MKLKSLIMASALAALGAATVVPPPIPGYEAQAQKKKKTKKKKSKKRTGNRNRSRSSAAARARNSGQNSRNGTRQTQRNADGLRATRQLMALPAGSRTPVRLSDTRTRYPGSRAADASPTREPRSRSGEASRMETSSVGSISTVSTVLSRQPMPEN